MLKDLHLIDAVAEGAEVILILIGHHQTRRFLIPEIAFELRPGEGLRQDAGLHTEPIPRRKRHQAGMLRRRPFPQINEIVGGHDAPPQQRLKVQQIAGLTQKMRLFKRGAVAQSGEPLSRRSVNILSGPERLR